MSENQVMEQVRARRRREIVDELRVTIRRFARDMPDEQFEELIERMADSRLRDAER